jgi:competence protein ComGC
MKKNDSPFIKKAIAGFTLLELVLMVLLIMAVLFFALPYLARTNSEAHRASCVNNLKQIGTACRIWSPDSSDYYPTQAKSGWKDVLLSTQAATFCWTNYFLMSNELGQSTKVLICPSDVRMPASAFWSNSMPSLANNNISYFVGAGAADQYPQSILAGDRNLAPGPQPSNDFGFSPMDGRGADVILSTNDKSVCWSQKMHSYATNGAGNLLLGDGSAQQSSSRRFRYDYLVNAIDAGMFPPGCTNTNGTIRLIFP